MMNDIYGYLAADATLKTLLGATSTDSRIYPDDAPENKRAPYIVYHVSRDGEADEMMKKASLRILIFSSTALLARNLGDRIIDMLDVQDDIQGMVPSSTWRYLYSKHTDGNSAYNSDTELYAKELVFNIMAVKL